MARTKVIGKLMPDSQVDISRQFNDMMMQKDGYDERLGLIPREVSPSKMRSVIQNAATGDLGDLYEVYEKMESTDSRYGGLVASLKSAMGGMPLKVIAAEGRSEGEKRLAEDYATVIEENLAMLDTHNLIKAFADVYITGAKVFSMSYRLEEYPYNRQIAVIDKVREVSGQRLGMETNQNSDHYGELLVKSLQRPEGVPVSTLDERRIFEVSDGDKENKYDLAGAARRCLGWYVTKIYAQLWWTEFVETYGQPIRIGRYPSGASDSAKNVMKGFLKMLGKSAYGLFPSGMEMQLLEPSGSANPATFKDLLETANKEMAVTILGQAETVGGQKRGSHAKVRELNSIRFEILQNVAKIIEKGFKHLTKNIIRVNYGGQYNARLLPRVQPILVNPQDTEKKIQVFEKAAQMGVQIPIDHIHEQLGIPKAKPGESIITTGGIITFDGDPETTASNARRNVQQDRGEGDDETESGDE
jgi:phage gp29-like protein